MPRLLLALSLFLWFSSCAALMTVAGERDFSFFENRIRPVLAEHCYSCHSADAKIVRGGLRLDSRQGTLAGGDSGPAVVPGDADQSLLIAALKHQSLEMPPEQKLPDQVIADFEQWIELGALDPRTESALPDTPVNSSAAHDHWAFQPIELPSVPVVAKATHRLGNPIDAFVLQKLNEQGWEPAPPADKYTLIRRATFDLIGLPPSEQEIRDFVNDQSTDSFAKLIDRLLASPHYGQRWGRHWLDLVRYADTNGADENHDLPNAWRYRDWVFRALNRDLPLDQFIIQQIAGDLLCDGQDEQTIGELITATGLLVIGPKMLAEQDKEKMRIDIVDEQIDTVSRTMLGMTIACARCHDHKFDPITSEDYYALAGIFASTRTMLNNDFVSQWMERDLPSTRIDDLRAQQQTKIDAAKQRVDEIIAEANRALMVRLAVDQLPENHQQQYPEAIQQELAAARELLKQAEQALPKYDSAMAVTEASPINLRVHLRGNHLDKRGEPVPRGVPRRLAEVSPITAIPADRSGRLELARWLTSPTQPLTARVMANRLWMWHFGQPLMGSPSNFGLQSERPLHHALLDWLARCLIDQGWSQKQMHRTIMLSNTYQMTSRTRSHESADPENQFLWRQNRRRLEVEPLRDAIQMVGGSLNRRFDGPSVEPNSARRAVYLKINRAALLDFFSTFDYVETANHLEQRPVTTVPNQALFLLNNALIHQQAQQLTRLLSDDPARRIERLWFRLFGRPPSEQETELATAFVDESANQLPKDSDPWAVLTRTLMAASGFSYVE